MGGLTIFGTFFIGCVLIIGEWLFPGHVVMWFASNSEIIHGIRPVILLVLLTMVLLHGLYDSVYLRLIWAMVAAALSWGGGAYFLNHPEYLFDVMYMLSAAICFAVAAMRPADDPLATPKAVKIILPGAAIAYYSRMYDPELPIVPTWRTNDDHDAGHRLMLQSSP